MQHTYDYVLIQEAKDDTKWFMVFSPGCNDFTDSEEVGAMASYFYD